MKTIQEKARRFILPYLYSGQKSDNSVNSITINLEQSHLTDASHDQGHQPATASPPSSQPTYKGEKCVAKAQLYREGIVSQISENCSQSHAPVDEGVPTSVFLASGEATTGAGNYLRHEQMFAPLMQTTGDPESSPESSSTSSDTSGTQTERFSGHAVGGMKKGAIMKRLVMDTVELIA
ncbi:hypothetical protein HDV57DRAFT_158944 [Trichoderma longibrachiatum]